MNSLHDDTGYKLGSIIGAHFLHHRADFLAEVNLLPTDQLPNNPDYPPSPSISHPRYKTDTATPAPQRGYMHTDPQHVPIPGETEAGRPTLFSPGGKTAQDPCLVYF